MDTRIPSILHPLLLDLAGQLNRKLPGKCTGLYIVGSLALDDFVPGQSDIDLVGVLDGPASADAFTTLGGIHHRVKQQDLKSKCDAMYFQQSDLGRQSGEIHPFPRYLLGKMTWMQHFPLSAVTWWTLQQHGITLFGPPAQTLPYSLDLDDLLCGQRQNLNTYWVSWVKSPLRILKLFSDWGVQWAILGVLRQIYTLREHKITSKSGAGEYALTRVPARWHPIIREALVLRRGEGVSFYPGRLKRAADAFHFLRFAIDSGNQHS